MSKNMTKYRKRLKSLGPAIFGLLVALLAIFIITSGIMQAFR